MKNLFKTLTLFFIITLSPQISSAQINYILSAELGQSFSNFETQETTKKDFNNNNQPEVGVRPNFSPLIGLVNTISFGEKQNFGARLKMQFESTHFSRNATYTYDDPVYVQKVENNYKLNRLNLPVEIYFKVGKVKFSAGVVNTWNLGGKIIQNVENDWGINSYYTTYEIGKTISSNPESFAGWSISTSLDKKYSLQSTFGFDFPLNNRWLIGASYRHSFTKSRITADIFDYDVFYSYEFQNQINSILVSLSYLLIK